MYQYAKSQHLREHLGFVALAILFGGGIFLLLLLIGGALFLATLAALAVMAVVGCFHYLFWGRSLEFDADRQAIESSKERFGRSFEGKAAPRMPRSSNSTPE